MAVANCHLRPGTKDNDTESDDCHLHLNIPGPVSLHAYFMNLILPILPLYLHLANNKCNDIIYM